MSRRGSRTPSLVVPVLVALMAWGVAASAQTSGGIVGTVTDSSAAVVAGATVVVENAQTGGTRSAQTDAEGRYAVNLLQIGRYSVRIELQGFKPYRRSGLDLAAGDRLRVDARLEVGGSTEQVDVITTAGGLQTDTATVGSLVTSTAVQDLPLTGRNYVELLQVTPGANPSVGNALSSGARPDDRRQTSSVSVNGQTELVNNNLIDGIDNNERSIGTIGVRPSIDAIAEIKVQTSLYTAEVGRTAGAVVNILTKSGTNDFHGSAFEFYRNDAFGAKNFFATGDKPADSLNQFGGSLGGPIVKDKTFFFADYEGLRITQGRPTGFITVPTAKMKQGDFSELLARSNPTVIYDPRTGRPFPGNVIPQDRINPIARNYMGLYPDPNVPGAGTSANYSTTNDYTQDTNTFDVRLDHRVGDSDNLYLRYSYNDANVHTPGTLPKVGDIDPGGAIFAFFGDSKTKVQGVHLNYLHMVSSNTLVEAKVGYMHFNVDSNPLSLGTNASEAFGLSNINTEEKFSGLSLATPANYPGIGSDAFLPIILANNTWQGTVSVSHNRGAHDFKFGVGVIERKYKVDQSAFPLGWYNFTQSQTASPTGTGGDGLASELLGLPNFANFGRTLGVLEYKSWEPSIYIQDDWRANRWLTVNLGVRYDVFTPSTESQNRMGNFDITTGQILYAGQNGVSNSAGVKTDWSDIAPRVGFAATIRPSLVLRGGYGISYVPMNYASGHLMKNIPFTASLFAFAPGSWISPPDLAPVNPATYAGDWGGGAVDTNFKADRLHQFNLVLEKDFSGTILSLGYVGSRGQRLLTEITDVNVAPPSPSAANVNPRRPGYALNPSIGAVGNYYTNRGSSNYNAFQARITRRMRAGLTASASYAYAKALNDTRNIDSGPSVAYSFLPNQMRQYDWGASDTDMRHSAVATINYQLPFGKSATGASKALLAGWQVNVLAFWRSGLPFTISAGRQVSHVSNNGNNADRASVVPGQSLTVDNPTLQRWFNTAAFVTPAQGTLGDAGRNTMEGPAQRRLDLSIFKDFDFGGSRRLQLRAECFNLTNTPSFGAPNNNLSSPTFGQITSGATNPRQIQFAAKFLF
jgi:hypothetical protein